MRVPTRKADKYLKGKTDPRITAEKFLELQKNLERMKKIRPALAAEVKRLAADGDFSENAAYQIAKGRLRGLNQGMLDTEEMIKCAEIIRPNKNKNIVSVGSFVELELNGKIKKYQILGSTESNPGAGIISDRSPLGQALIGKHIGEIIKIKLAQKTVEYKVTRIE
ncbi:MAG: GreA/GreB family elongation factor [Patescibacteria group bacterium]|jgi:transcription elongation GreA/GreB family factor